VARNSVRTQGDGGPADVSYLGFEVSYMLPVENPKSTERHDPGAYCAGFIEFDPISRISLVTQLICRLYPLGVRV
jgi:hypothetical protein